MKRLLGIACLIVALILMIAHPACAIDVTPYVKVGTIDTDEQDHSNAVGHKAMFGVGIDVAGGDKFRKELNAELWSTAEPTDEDREMVHDGIVLSVKGSYHFTFGDDLRVYPLAGVGFEKWRRNSPDDDQDKFFGDLMFTEVIVGVGAEYRKFYCVLECTYPFWTDTDSGHRPEGELGFDGKVGILLWENVDCGLFYERTSFSGDGSQTDFQMERYGFSLGYRF